jgi:hypothetical protein
MNVDIDTYILQDPLPPHPPSGCQEEAQLELSNLSSQAR